ncbi:PAR12 polymerase, partial [Polypterus senegalus]
MVEACTWLWLDTCLCSPLSRSSAAFQLFKPVKKITLLQSSEEYGKVKKHFEKTMYGFQITKIERIQNKALWEVFQWQKEQMRKTKNGKPVNEKNLFHGTDLKNIDAICKHNFDWRICGTNGTAYGKGILRLRRGKGSRSCCFLRDRSDGIMTAAAVTKLLCANNGAMGYDELRANVGGDAEIERTLADRQKFAVVTAADGTRRIIAKTSVKLCKAQSCQGCSGLHLCKFYLYGDCKFSRRNGTVCPLLDLQSLLLTDDPHTSKTGDPVYDRKTEIKEVCRGQFVTKYTASIYRLGFHNSGIAIMNFLRRRLSDSSFVANLPNGYMMDLQRPESPTPPSISPATERKQPQPPPPSSASAPSTGSSFLSSLSSAVKQSTQMATGQEPTANVTPVVRKPKILLVIDDAHTDW